MLTPETEPCTACSDACFPWHWVSLVASGLPQMRCPVSVQGVTTGGSRALWRRNLPSAPPVP